LCCTDTSTFFLTYSNFLAKRDYTYSNPHNFRNYPDSNPCNN
jgi:hypothetical protein